MRIINKKINNFLSSLKSAKRQSGGFTLIETMMAIFILALATNGLLSVIGRSFFTSRYANNEITANYLLQEAVDKIRNDRDSIVFQQNNRFQPINGSVFITKYSTCFTTNGCEFEVARPSFGINACSTTSGCDRIIYYNKNANGSGFYTYDSTITGAIDSTFKRQILMVINSTNSDELDIKVTVSWMNGGSSRSKSMWVSLLDWQK